MGTFGWIIGTTSETRLAAVPGPVFGFDPPFYLRAGMTSFNLYFSSAVGPCLGPLSFVLTTKAC
jgi:hypothetical protein